MALSIFSKFVFVLIATLSLGFLYWILVQQEGTPHLPAAKQELNPYPLLIKGFSYETYDTNQHRHIMKIEADEFKVNPRKFWVFNVSKVNEVTLTNVRLEVYSSENSSELDLFSFGEEILSLKQGKDALKRFGIITRGVIKGLVLQIYNEDDEPSIMVQAKEAHIDFKKKKTRFTKVVIKNAHSNEFIKSRRVIWDRKEKVFRIPGEYVMFKQNEMKRGKKIKVDLEFEITPL